MPRRSFLGSATYLAMLFSVSSSVHAHARLVRSEPKDGARLTESPAQIELWFNELLDEKFNRIELFRTEDKKTNLGKEKPVLDPKDRTHLTLKLPPLAPGEYVVEYRVLSRDGHTAPGRMSFVLSAKPQG
jgi:methionine-rich copper-binding protein CopC